jgi:hypothetical protein
MDEQKQQQAAEVESKQQKASEGLTKYGNSTDHLTKKIEKKTSTGLKKY